MASGPVSVITVVPAQAAMNCGLKQDAEAPAAVEITEHGPRLPSSY
jgi:hypothetical protein